MSPRACVAEDLHAHAVTGRPGCHPVPLMIQEPAAADVGSDYTCAGRWRRRTAALSRTSLPARSRAAADAELELAVGKEVCRRDFLGQHVERVLVVVVDDTGAP